MNRKIVPLVVLAVAALLVWTGLVGGAASAQSDANGATAELKDAQGMTVGTATLMPLQSGEVKIMVQVSGFTAAAAGEHGVHIHAVGKCEGPEFTSAGGHFNPTSAKHGTNNPEGPHSGDLPNLIMNADGSATYEAMTSRISLGADAPNSIFDADGTALVIHAKPDDLMTDPSGNSGTRVACGALMAAMIPTGMPSTGTPDVGAYYFWLVLGVALLATGFVAVRARRYN